MGNMSKWHNHLATQRTIYFHECNVFVMLLSDGGGQLTQSDKLICDIDNLHF